MNDSRMPNREQAMDSAMDRATVAMAKRMAASDGIEWDQLDEWARRAWIEEARAAMDDADSTAEAEWIKPLPK